MARAQMLTIVTPGAPAHVLPQTLQALDHGLRASGCTHFATLALLPGPPSDAIADTPSLLFEIVLDDKIDAPSAVDMLLRHATDPLWALYEHAWSGLPSASPHVRSSWLREYMLEHAQAAACGFIGARDRNVGQILAEKRLLDDARREFASLHGVSPLPTSAQLAENVREWAWRSPHAGLLLSPAPRSIWRNGGMPALLRWPALALRLVVPAMAILALLGSLGASVGGLGHGLTMAMGRLDIAGAGWIARQGTDVFAIPGLAAVAVLVLLVIPLLLARLMGALTLMLLLTILSAASLVVLLGFIREDWTAVWIALQLVASGAGSLVCVAAAAGTVLALATLSRLRGPPHSLFFIILGSAALMACFTGLAAAFTMGHLAALHGSALAWRPDISLKLQRLGWILMSCIPVALLLIVAPTIVLRLQSLGRRMFQSGKLPDYRPSGPLHQVHESIDRCEARLIGRQSHMISLTEMRRPTAWHGNWLRLKLWLVNQLADVYFVDGRLGMADGIKFGHWRLIDGGRRLLFCSNYDGSFGGYLDGFIYGAWQGVNLIWGATELLPRPAAAPGQPGVTHGRCFPPVRWFIFHGCRYEQAFKAYARASMVPNLHRFEAYNLSLHDIELATRLREALSRPRDTRTHDQILRALES